MARGRSSHGGGGGGALLACNRAIDRKDEYEKNVKKLQATTKIIAETIRTDSDLADILNQEDDGADAWLKSNRDRLKAIAEGNAKRLYEIEYFVDAVKEVRTDVERRQHENNNQGGGAPAEGAQEGAAANAAAAAADAPDYERSISDAVEKLRTQRENDPSRVSAGDHAMTTEVRETLGEKVQKKRSAAGGGDDDEDELEIVQNRVDDVNALKCPVTGMLFNNPVINKVCHHTYDRAGLDQLLRTGKHTCPVPGCANNRLSLNQVEEDEEMKLKVQRHKTREVAQKRQRDLEEDDDEEDGEGGYTMIE